MSGTAVGTASTIRGTAQVRLNATAESASLFVTLESNSITSFAADFGTGFQTLGGPPSPNLRSGGWELPFAMLPHVPATVLIGALRSNTVRFRFDVDGNPTLAVGGTAVFSPSTGVGKLNAFKVQAPGSTSNGLGDCVVRLLSSGSDADGGFPRIALSLTVASLSGPVVSVALHGPAAADETAGVLLPLPNIGLDATQQHFSGEFDIDATTYNALIDDRAYISVATDAFPAGEIRSGLAFTPGLSPVVLPCRDIRLDAEKAPANGVILHGHWVPRSCNIHGPPDMDGQRCDGNGFVHDGNQGKGSKYVRFSTHRLDSTGPYTIAITYTYSSSRAVAVPVTVVHRDGTAVFTIDQTKPPPPATGPDAGAFVLPEAFVMVPGRSYVQIDTAGTSGKVVVDSVSFRCFPDEITLSPSPAPTLSAGATASPTASASGSCNDKLVDAETGQSAASFAGRWVQRRCDTDLPRGRHLCLGDFYFHDANGGKGRKSVTFSTVSLETIGFYRVSVAYSRAASRAFNVPITISAADGDHLVMLNQRSTITSHNGFTIVGVFELVPGVSTVRISNEGTIGKVIVDSVLFECVADDRISPTVSPTWSPTFMTFEPTSAPTSAPTIDPAPTSSPTASPTRTPTNSPTASPTHAPTDAPTRAPTIACQVQDQFVEPFNSGAGATVPELGTVRGTTIGTLAMPIIQCSNFDDQGLGPRPVTFHLLTFPESATYLIRLVLDNPFDQEGVMAISSVAGAGQSCASFGCTPLMGFSPTGFPTEVASFYDRNSAFRQAVAYSGALPGGFQIILQLSQSKASQSDGYILDVRRVCYPNGTDEPYNTLSRFATKLGFSVGNDNKPYYIRNFDRVPYDPDYPDPRNSGNFHGAIGTTPGLPQGISTSPSCHPMSPQPVQSFFSAFECDQDGTFTLYFEHSDEVRPIVSLNLRVTPITAQLGSTSCEEVDCSNNSWSGTSRSPQYTIAPDPSHSRVCTLPFPPFPCRLLQIQVHPRLLILRSM